MCQLLARKLSSTDSFRLLKALAYTRPSNWFLKKRQPLLESFTASQRRERKKAASHFCPLTRVSTSSQQLHVYSVVLKPSIKGSLSLCRIQRSHRHKMQVTCCLHINPSHQVSQFCVHWQHCHMLRFSIVADTMHHASLIEALNMVEMWEPFRLNSKDNAKLYLLYV